MQVDFSLTTKMISRVSRQLWFYIQNYRNKFGQKNPVYREDNQSTAWSLVSERAQLLRRNGLFHSHPASSLKIKLKMTTEVERATHQSRHCEMSFHTNSVISFRANTVQPFRRRERRRWLSIWCKSNRGKPLQKFNEEKWGFMVSKLENKVLNVSLEHRE